MISRHLPLSVKRGDIHVPRSTFILLLVLALVTGLFAGAIAFGETLLRLHQS